MKIEKPKRYFKRVSNGDGIPLVFSYLHLPLIQRLLEFKDTDMAIVIGVPAHKLHRTMQMSEPLPERINSGINTLLIQRFSTANICWIALNTWAREDWGLPEVISSESEFSCRYIHPESGFAVVCECREGFRIDIIATETTLTGIYGFSQVNPFLNVLEDMVKVDSAEWLGFWAKAQVARKADLAQRIAAKAALGIPGSSLAAINSSSVSSSERKKSEMSEVVAAIEKEASEGGADAKYSAGRALAMGIGMEKPDLEKATYWLVLASSEGHFQATKLLTKVKKTAFERRSALLQ
jgi:hypothetical protein